MNLRPTLSVALGLFLFVISSRAFSQTAGDYVAHAKEEIAEHNYDAAALSCSRALQLNPRLAEAYSLRGVAEAMSAEPDLAWRDFNAAITLDKTNAVNYRYRAGLEEHNDQNEDALLDLDTAIRLEPTNADGYNLRGFLYLVMHDSTAAESDLNRALTLQPKFADAHYNRGVLYEWMQRNDAARAEYSRVIQLDSSDARGWAGRARVLTVMSDTMAARLDIQRAIDIDPLPYYYQLRAGVAASAEEALRTLDTAIEIDPTDASSYYVRGVGRRESGDTTGAMADFAQATRIAPTYTTALMAGAELRADLAEYYSAVEEATQAIMSDSSNAQYYDYRASYYLDLGDSDRALTDYRQAIALNERDSDALAARAWILNDRGNEPQCIAAIQDVLLHYPKEAWAHRYLAWYLRSDDPKRAIAEYDTAIAFDGTDGDDFYWRGRTKQDLDDYAAAERDFKSAIALDSLAVYNWRSLGLARSELKHYADALAALDHAIKLRPADGMLWADRASVREAMNDVPGASEDFRRCVEQSQTVEAYLLRSRFFLRQRDTLKAIDDLTAAINRNAGTDSYKTRAVLEEQSGLYENAASDYTILLTREPSDARPWLWRGNVYYRWGRYQQAYDDYSVSIGLDPNIAATYVNRAQMATKLFRDSIAMEDATRAIELDSTQVNAYFVRGWIECNRHNFAEAVADYTHVVERDPGRHDVYLYRALCFEDSHDHARALRDAKAGADAIDHIDPTLAARIRALRP